MQNEKDAKLIYEFEDLICKVKNKLEAKDLALRKAERQNNNLSGDEEATMIIERLRAYFDKYSYLNVHAEINTNDIKTWDDFLNKMYNHIIY